MTLKRTNVESLRQKGVGQAICDFDSKVRGRHETSLPLPKTHLMFTI